MKTADYPMLKSDPIGSTIYQKSVMNVKFVTLVETYSAVISVHLQCLNPPLEFVPSGDWKYPVCKKGDIPSKPEVSSPPDDQNPPAHSLNSLYALAKAGDQIEKKSHLITMFLLKRDKREGWSGRITYCSWGCSFAKKENEEKEQGVERDTRYTVSGQALKDKYAKARQRQKRKIAKGIARQSSGLDETEPPIAIGLNREKSSAYDINSHKLEKPVSRSNRWTGRKMWCGSSLNSGHNNKSDQVISIRPLNQIPHCLSADHLSTMRLKTHAASLKSSGLDFPSRLMLGDDVNNNMKSWSGLNHLREEPWFEEELDSVWTGVCRHGQRDWDWEAIVRDSTLKFSRSKTTSDISMRWNEEILKILNKDYLLGQKSIHFQNPSTSQRLPRIDLESVDSTVFWGRSGYKFGFSWSCSCS